jgi:ubiquinone biosynthesis protein
VPSLLNRAGTILDQVDDITRNGLVLAPESVAAIGRAEARSNRWTAAALWMIALMLGWIAWLIL